jgi:hypothetical protein
VPSSLRFLPPRKPGQHPALIAPFGLAHECRPGELVMPPERIKGVHLTLLCADGSGKADCEPNKLMIGSSSGWPLCIAPANDLGGLAVAEGVENALSLLQDTGLGAWAAGCANRLPLLADRMPPHVEVVTISVDDDDAGRRYSDELAKRLLARGIEVIMLEAASVRTAA